jgi:DNA replication protein DnaC
MATIFKSVYDAVLYTGRRFDAEFNLHDDQRSMIYRRVFNCLSGSDKCEELKIRPDKGILLIGDKGVGKTLMMRVMQILFKDTPRRFRWVSSLEIYDMLREGTDEIVIKEMYGKSLKSDLYIDDIGMMPGDYHKFKNTTNIIAEILFERDELFVLEGFRTHMSSNIRTTVPKETAPEVKSLERLYGDRILDRVKQMTNLITWQGASLRK